MIVTIAEHQHLKNDYVCRFCERRPVVGRAYYQLKHDYPEPHYLFAYCADCGIEQAEKMARLVHPDYRVRKIAAAPTVAASPASDGETPETNAAQKTCDDVVIFETSQSLERQRNELSERLEWRPVEQSKFISAFDVSIPGQQCYAMDRDGRFYELTLPALPPAPKEDRND